MVKNMPSEVRLLGCSIPTSSVIDCVTLYKCRKLSVRVHHLQQEEDGTYFLHCSEESRANTHKVLITGLPLRKHAGFS